jgi:hypothetical protein
MGTQGEGSVSFCSETPGTEDNYCLLVSEAIWGQGARLTSHALEAPCFYNFFFNLGRESPLANFT